MKYEMLSRNNLPYAVAIAKELHALGAHNVIGPPFDWDYAYRTFTYVCDSPNNYMQLAVDDDGVYVGAVCGHVDQFMFSPRYFGSEDGWYVREGTPKRAAVAVRLMRGFIDWCDSKHVLYVQTGDIADIHSHAVDTLYRHMGFKRFGTMYRFQRT